MVEVPGKKQLKLSYETEQSKKMAQVFWAKSASYQFKKKNATVGKVQSTSFLIHSQLFNL